MITDILRNFHELCLQIIIVFMKTKRNTIYLIIVCSYFIYLNEKTSDHYHLITFLFLPFLCKCHVRKNIYCTEIFNRKAI